MAARRSTGAPSSPHQKLRAMSDAGSSAATTAMTVRATPAHAMIGCPHTNASGTKWMPTTARMSGAIRSLRRARVTHTTSATHATTSIATTMR